MKRSLLKKYYPSCEIARLEKYIQVKPSTVGGRGAFASTKIRAGTTVGSMRGPIVAKDDVHVLWVEDSPNKWTLIEVLGPARYINHSQHPNVELIEKPDRIEVRALRTIQAGEELFFEYDTSQGDHFKLVDPKPYELSPASLKVFNNPK